MKLPHPRETALNLKFPLALGAVLFLAFWPAFVRPASAKPVVVLDAAHGGSDNGVESGSRIEKEWNLKFAKALEKVLKKMEFAVVMVRSGDETISPEKRAQTANASKASVVLIIHADREWSETQTGPYLVVQPPTRTESGEGSDISKWGGVSSAQYKLNLKLARALARNLGAPSALSSLSDSRGMAGESSSAEGRVLCGSHLSLRNINSPALVLIPMFLTSSSDLDKFSKDSALGDFAEKVGRGLAEFLKGSGE